MMQEYNRILVAVDGSDSSLSALKKAVSITKRNQGKLYIVHILDDTGSLPFDVAQFEKIARNKGNELLEKCHHYAIENGLDDVGILMEVGSPRTMISSTIPERENIDLIIMGARGLNAVERIFIGSVSDFVIRRAICDVLIVKTESDIMPEILMD